MLGAVALTNYPLTVSEMAKKNILNSQIEKNAKNILTIMSKPDAHLQTVNKSFAKFQKDSNKIVGRVMLANTHSLHLR